MNERANLNSNENIRKWEYEWKKGKRKIEREYQKNKSMNEKSNVNSNENIKNNENENIRKWKY
jgi:hypothetical protein